MLQIRLLCVSFCLLVATTAGAGTITVTDNVPFGLAGSATCTLAQAIAAANAVNGVQAVAVGSATTNLGKCIVAPNRPAQGANTIVFSTNLDRAILSYSPSDFTSVTTNTNTADNYWYGPNALPPIASDITIDGGAAGVTLQINAATSRLRFFYVGVDPAYLAGIATPGKGSLTLKNLTLRGGVQRGGKSGKGGGGAGLGGAIFNQGSLSLTNVTLSENSAIGGDWTGNGADGFGGGGLGEDAKTPEGGGFGGSLGFSLGNCCNGENAATTGTLDGGTGMTWFNGGRGGKVGTNGGLGGADPYTGSLGDGGAGGSASTTQLSQGGASGGGGAGFGGIGGSGGPGGPLVDAGGKGGDFGQGGHLVPINNGNGGGGGGGGGVGGGGASTVFSYNSVSNTITGASISKPGNGGFGGGGGFSANLLGPPWAGASGGFGGGGASGLGCFFSGCSTSEGNGGFGAGRACSGCGGGGMGGAIFNHLGTVRLFQVTAFRNTAVGGNGQPQSGLGRGLGAVLFNLNGTITIDFSTLYNNGGPTVFYNILSALGTSMGHYYGNFGTLYGPSSTVGVHYVDASIYSLAFGTQIKDGTASSASLTINNSIIAGTNQAGTEITVDNGGNIVGTAAATVATQDVINHAVGNGNQATLVYQGTNFVGQILNQGIQSGGSATTSGPSPSTSDPRLASADANHGPTWTMLPETGSPVIDVAANCLDSLGQMVAFDQRGVARPQPDGGQCDVGAVELKQALLNVTVNGSGSVSAGDPPTPVGGAIATCTNAGGASCAAGYSTESGWANVTLTATVPAGQSVAWSGDCVPVGGEPTKATAVMDQARACTATFAPMVLASATVVSSDRNPSVYGQSATFSAKVTGLAPTGSVAFTSGTTVLCNAVLLSGGGNSPTTTCSTATLPVGASAIVASYSGDGSNAPSSDTLMQVVDKKSTTVSLAARPSPAAVVGQVVTLTATVAGDPPTGTVSFYDNGVPLPCSPVTLVVGAVSSSATCTTTFTAVGTRSITATYAGDANFTPVTSSVFALIVNASASADAVPVPMLAHWMLLLLSGLLGAMGLARLRRA